MKEKKVVFNSFFYSQLNYCPFVYVFLLKKSLNKVERLQNRALKFLYNDYVNPYDGLLNKYGLVAIELKLIRSSHL